MADDLDISDLPVPGAAPDISDLPVPPQTAASSSGTAALKDVALGIPEAAMTGVESLYGIPAASAASIGTRVLSSLGLTDKTPEQVKSAVSNYLIHNPQTDTAKMIVGALSLPAHWAGQGAD